MEGLPFYAITLAKMLPVLAVWALFAMARGNTSTCNCTLCDGLAFDCTVGGGMDGWADPKILMELLHAAMSAL